MALRIKNNQFTDEKGRTVLLRGVNLGGSSKVPILPNGATHLKSDFSDHRDVSFIGRPFSLKEADEHFSRLKSWGFNCLRFLVTWEAIEHSGPKEYDNGYLDYLEEILKIAGEFGFYIFIDVHQDVWSRMTGGDGAPGWTFELVGLDYTKFESSEASLTMQKRYDPKDQSNYLPMHWMGNTYRFANGTMWTLFFGGRDYAPSCRINGINIQDYLQNHFFDAVKKVALRLKDNSHVLGFDILNEPSEGWIGKFVDGSEWKGKSEVLGYVFTPIDAMLTGAGYSRVIGYQEVKRFGIKETRKDELNQGRISCWLEGFEDIWRKEGIWDLNELGNPEILKNDYFINKNGEKVDFYRNYYSPFLKNYTDAIRSVYPNAIIFLTGPMESVLKGESLELDVPHNSVHAAHWYDVATTGTKKAMLKANYNIITGTPVIGKQNVRQMFVSQLEQIKNYSHAFFKGIPTIIEEFGLPFDLNNKEAYTKLKTEPSEAWKTHIKALNNYYNALDANLLHALQWNYTPDNTNEWGDHWNFEDLSIYSLDQRINPENIDSGGRAISGFCRPHFLFCTGNPLKMEFKMKEGFFYFEFYGDASIEGSTVLFIPEIHFPNGYNIDLSEGEIDRDKRDQLVSIIIKENGVHTVKITKV
ncbi:MAG: glycosyl hydrolase family 5 [Candidatus Lokiarchaeota archaeon]|nr:glycosyl hydrolase family 5 [Candidatus Lokiarchaeota archaeon]